MTFLHVTSQTGNAEVVVLVHAGIFADWFRPLLDEPALVGRYRVVSYHRAGCAGSGRAPRAYGIAAQAAHLRALLRHLGIARPRRRAVFEREHRATARARCARHGAVARPARDGAAP